MPSRSAGLRFTAEANAQAQTHQRPPGFTTELKSLPSFDALALRNLSLIFTQTLW